MSMLSKVSSRPVSSPGLEAVLKEEPVKPVSVFNNSEARAAVVLPRLPIKDSDLEEVGKDLSRKVGATTEKIMTKMTVGKFDELGQILTAIQTEANNLDPASLNKNGLVGWFQNRFTDVKAKLTLRLKSAEQVFNGLEAKIATHITTHAEWVKDLEILYTENYERWQELVKTIAKLETWETSSQAVLNSWPPIAPDDPEAMMKGQALNDARSLVNRIGVKRDNFARLKVIAESNGPRIRSQQQTSRDNIDTLRQIVEQVIPMIKIDFAMFLQSLDAKKSIELVNATRNLANKTLKTSADSAKDTALLAARNVNTANIEADTLNHIRTRMIETVTDVRRIQDESRAQRLKEAQEIETSQKQYLISLTNNGAV